MDLAVGRIPLALYVHLPWCVHKCPYCDFNSYEASGVIPEIAYVDALLADLQLDAPLMSGRAVSSIFIGGGTPSLFTGGAITKLLDGIRATVALSTNAEITLEANPGTVDEAHFVAYRVAGVNRLSLGVQSLRDPQLKQLGRVHSANDARRAVTIARAAGFENLNIDLMHGLPGDQRGDALADLEAALALQPEHLSWYQLTLEAGTAFERRPPRLPPHDQIAEEFEAGCAMLDAEGFDRYEVSAFARPNRESRHNRNYWEFGDYLGIGAGAHGKLTMASGIERRIKRRHPNSYLKEAGTSAAVTVEQVGSDALTLEFMLNALRLRTGFTRALFTARTGLPESILGHGINIALERGWLREDRDVLLPTALGYRFLNDLQLIFVP